MRTGMRTPRPALMPLAAAVSLVVVGPLLVLTGCGPRTWEPSVVGGDVVPSPQEDRLLRGHLQAGGMVVMSRWEPPSVTEGFVTGFGIRLGPANDTLSAGELQVPLDSVVLWASEDPHTVARFPMSGLSLWTGLSGLITVVCLADPKGCFGSCPTFYLDDGDGERLVAEGFSSSFARVLEATDVDALPRITPSDVGRSLSLIMRNEAPETHAVRAVRLLAVPRPPGAEVLATGDGRFRVARDPAPPRSCHSPGRPGETDCRLDVSEGDGREYYSLADSADLAAREMVTVEFDAPPHAPPGASTELGLVVRARNSLLSTYVFYQTIAYLGSRAETWLAELERGDPVFRERALGLARELGDVQVLLERDGRWEVVGRFAEAGPIASDVHLVPLGDVPSGPIRVALRMARGNWRIDRLGLARLGPEVSPTPLEPVAVEPIHGPLSRDEARARLVGEDDYLVTHRGDAYRLRWELPTAASDLELFLHTRGYYYEWMRPEWKAEESAVMAALIFTDPASALRRMAPGFKSREAHMEETFWSSRFRREEP